MTIEEEAVALLLEEVEEHISEIMLTSHESPDPDCLLCQRGIDLGVWRAWSVDDPFAPD